MTTFTSVSGVVFAGVAEVTEAADAAAAWLLSSEAIFLAKAGSSLQASMTGM
jgi:hypothetical protein